LAFFSNQTINGFVRRLNGPNWLWIPLGVVVAAVGLWQARAAHRSGNALAAVVLIGLTALIVAPVSWLASTVWIAPAIGLLLGDATQRGRVIAALAVLALFLARLPMLGDKLVRVYPIPFIGSALENSYVVVLVLLILILPRLTDPRLGRKRELRSRDSSISLASAAPDEPAGAARTYDRDEVRNGAKFYLRPNERDG
jgi:hypothetical protein